MRDETHCRRRQARCVTALLASMTCLAALASAAKPSSAALSDVLQFQITEGAVDNHFYRRGPIAAHLLTTSGPAPRLIVAFPAGNCGIGLWFEPMADPASFTLAPGTQVDGVQRLHGMRGVSALLRSDARSLTIHDVVLANIRTLRDYIANGAVLPPELASYAEPGKRLRFRRTTLDGLHHIELQLAPKNGTRLRIDGGKLRFEAGEAAGVSVAVTALADDPPLTPFRAADLFTEGVAPRRRDQQVFAFLASEEKFTAGSWRFLTYFGRDTLLSVQLLLPVLQPPVVEAALGSVVERLSPDGEVAHEEGIGEFAAIENRKRHPPPTDLLSPILDYKMIDGDFLLAPALAAYVLDTPAGAARAQEYFGMRTTTGERFHDRIERNLRRVLALATPFAERPRFDMLVALKPGVPVGNWRDSTHGLGGGRYPFDVNVALVPAALRATARIYRCDAFGANEELATRADRLAAAWSDVERFFRVTVPPEVAKQQVAAYATSLGLDATASADAIDRPVVFDALALDAAGKPVPVMHTDAGFVLFFTDPSADYLTSVTQQLLRPFPAGLRTAVGLVVANPVFGDDGVRKTFTAADYHGTVVWSWQQALMAAGLKRQLARGDLPEDTRIRLRAAERELWKLILALQPQSTGELWSWTAKDGTETVTPFGQARGHVDESNAAQLWSTVYLAVQPPR